MGSKILTQTTTNRGEFNRAYKAHLEHTGKIRCTYCGYHKNENARDKKWYGGYDEKNIRHPNWKLVSRNNKQWMKKPICFVKKVGKISKKTYAEIEFLA